MIMNDDHFNNKMVTRTYIQHLPLMSIITNILDLFHYAVIISG